MRGKRKDANQNLIENEFTARGASVHDLSQHPKQLDMLVGYRGVTAWVEVKNPAMPPSGRKLTDSEDGIIKGWRGLVAVIEDVPDVEALLTVMGQQALEMARGRIKRGEI